MGCGNDGCRGGGGRGSGIDRSPAAKKGKTRGEREGGVACGRCGGGS